MPLGLKKSQESPLPKPPTVPKVTRQTIWVRKMQLFVGKSAFRLRNAVCPACKPANRARNSLPQIAGKHFRTKKPRRKLRNDKFALKKAAATCEKLFRVKDVVPQLAATFFGHAMQIPRRTFPLLPKMTIILYKEGSSIRFRNDRKSLTVRLKCLSSPHEKLFEKRKRKQSGHT